MSEGLIFIKEENAGVYRFDFSEDIDTAWGDGWNVSPAGLLPKIEPERNAISNSYRVVLDKHLNLACKNTCFSMQDCIDGIIVLGFTDIHDDEILIFKFGDDINDVLALLAKYGNNIEHLTLDGDEALGNLIKDLNEDDEEDE